MTDTLLQDLSQYKKSKDKSKNTIQSTLFLNLLAGHQWPTIGDTIEQQTLNPKENNVKTCNIYISLYVVVVI